MADPLLAQFLNQVLAQQPGQTPNNLAAMAEKLKAAQANGTPVDPRAALAEIATKDSRVADVMDRVKQAGGPKKTAALLLDAYRKGEYTPQNPLERMLIAQLEKMYG